MIYFIIIVILLILTYVYDFSGIKKGKKTYYYIVLMILILTAGLRYRIGLDSIRYMSTFEELPDLFSVSLDDYNETKYNPIYYLLVLISKTIYPSFVFFQILHAFIVNIVVFYFIKKNTEYIFLGVLLYYIFCFTNFNFEVLKESIAVVFFMFAADSLISRKWIKYYLLVFFAFLCHSSAILLFLIPFLINLKLSSRLYLYIIGVFVFGLMIIDYIDPILNIISITESLEQKSQGYADTDLMNNRLNINGIISVGFQHVIFPLVALRFLKIKYKLNYKFELFVILNMFVAVLSMIFILFYRYHNYFILFNIFLFADVLGKAYKYHSYKFSSVFVLVTFPALIYLQYLTYFSLIEKNQSIKTYSRYYPYSSIINPKKDDNRERLFRYYNVNY